MRGAAKCARVVTDKLSKGHQLEDIVMKELMPAVVTDITGSTAEVKPWFVGPEEVKVFSQMCCDATKDRNCEVVVGKDQNAKLQEKGFE